MLSPSEYRSLDGIALAELIKGKQISAKEALQCCLREIDRLNPLLNAVVMRNDALSVSEADQLASSHLLSGVPFLAKDINVNIKGYKTTHACRFFANSKVHDQDSLLVERWRDAGLVITGRTNTPEFATNFGCEPEFYGPTLNPWNTKLTPGGSSGGAAVAVATGMVTIAHATDSGGSIRAPAACCGVFGFKPSSGLVATGSALGHLVNGLNADHVVTRSVRDSAAMLDATAGSELASPMSFDALATRKNQPNNNKKSTYLNVLGLPLKRLRIGITDQSPTGMLPTQEIRDKFHQTATMLESLGHEVTPWSWPPDSDPCDVASVFWMAELASVIEQYIEHISREPEPAELGPLVRAAWLKAKSVSSVDMVKARVRCRQLQINMHQAMTSVDVLMTPVLTESPLPSGLLTELVNKDTEKWMQRAWQFAPYLEIFNVTGQPAMSVPLHESHDGLPIGMHFVAAVGEDAMLLQLAAELESHTRWRERSLPLSDEGSLYK